MKNNPVSKARKTIFTISAFIFAVCIMMAMMFSASASEVELGECSENNGSGHTILESSKSIYTTITCNACGETLYKSDDRWHEGSYGYHHDDVYVEVGYGMIATFNDHYNSDDVLVAYYVADSIDGNGYEFNFDCKGYRRGYSCSRQDAYSVAVPSAFPFLARKTVQLCL